MAVKLITLPLRVWFRSARLLTRVAGDAAGRAVSLAGQTIGVGSPNGSSSDRGRSAESATPEPGWREESIDRPVSPVDVEHPREEPERPAAPAQPRDSAGARAVTAVRPPQEEPVEPVAPTVPEPVHVSEEPVLVDEVAEPGAEEGAGAAITVLEPWKGYAHMNAREVIARAQQAGPAELAAVRLYESRHRSRQTVLAAVDRQLKLSGGGRPA
jgi:hypothetical protein